MESEESRELPTKKKKRKVSEKKNLVLAGEKHVFFWARIPKKEGLSKKKVSFGFLFFTPKNEAREYIFSILED